MGSPLSGLVFISSMKSCNESSVILDILVNLNILPEPDDSSICCVDYTVDVTVVVSLPVWQFEIER